MQEAGVRGRGEHSGVTAQRLAHQDGLLEAELFEYGDGIRDVRGPGHVPNAGIRTAHCGRGGLRRAPTASNRRT
jgi:hypothetical protein